MQQRTPRLFWAWSVLIASLLLGAFGAHAMGGVERPRGPTRIAVVDVRRVLAEADYMDAARRWRRRRQAQVEASIAADREALQARVADLRRDRRVLNRDTFAVRLRTLERRLADLRRRIEDTREAPRRAFAARVERFQTELLSAVSDLARRRDLDLVVTRQTAVLAKTNLDLTQAVLSELNQALPTYPHPLPDPTPP